MNIDLVLKRLELIKEGKEIGTISDVEASIILNKIERLKKNQKLTPEERNHLHLELDEIVESLQLENERLNNIINTILDFNFFKEECPLNFGYTEKCDEEKAQDVFYEDDYCEENCNDDYKKCWLKYFERLQELKGSE